MRKVSDTLKLLAKNSMCIKLYINKNLKEFFFNHANNLTVMHYTEYKNFLIM